VKTNTNTIEIFVSQKKNKEENKIAPIKKKQLATLKEQITQ
jgi:hypothetical protein